MTQVIYRANLSIKQWPFLTDFQGQTVIVPGQDNTFNRSLTSSEDADKDVGMPAAYYMHNVLPAPYGFNSVGYTQVIPPKTPQNDYYRIKFAQANAVSATVNGPQFYFSPKLSGIHYTYQLGGVGWIAIGNVVAITSTTVITYAQVQGITYIYFSKIGCYKWDSVSNLLVAVTLTGLVAANVLGITAIQGYLIAYDASTIYHSSILDIDYTLNAVDFTPSLLTGAGSDKPLGARGSNLFVLPASFGLAIYTQSNIVSAVYTGNPRTPFAFTEIAASGGGISPELVSYDSNSGDQYAYTTSGFQVVNQTTTKTVFPELTDFVAGADFEDFNETTMVFIQLALTTPMKKRLTAISDRYLIFSYGVASLTHALVYDMAQKRWGKFKIDHVDVVEFTYLDPLMQDSPRLSIGFLKNTGEVVVANPTITLASSRGVIVAGKYQYVRERMLTLESVVLQTVHPNQSASVYDAYSVSGGTVDSQTTVQLYETSVSGQPQRSYKAHVTGKNHTIIIIGGFFLSSLVLGFHVHGKR